MFWFLLLALHGVLADTSTLNICSDDGRCELVKRVYNCEVSEREMASADANLRLDDHETSSARGVQFAFGIPSCKTGKLLTSEYYTSCYSPTKRIGLWTAHMLTSAMAGAKREREDCWRSDPRLKHPETESAVHEDYDDDRYDIGHLVPRDDMSITLDAQTNTFLYSNAAPQWGTFNRNLWNNLEGYVRDCARKYGDLYVITGVIVHGDAEKLPPLNRLPIPSKFFKILIDKKESPPDLLAFMSDNKAQPNANGRSRDERLGEYVVTVHDIEQLVAIDLLPSLKAEWKQIKTTLFDGGPIGTGAAAKLRRVWNCKN